MSETVGAMRIIAEKIGEGDTATAFNVMIGIVLLFTTISYIVIFPAFIKLRRSHAHVNRPYKVPGGMVKMAANTEKPMPMKNTTTLSDYHLEK